MQLSRMWNALFIVYWLFHHPLLQVSTHIHRNHYIYKTTATGATDSNLSALHHSMGMFPTAKLRCFAFRKAIVLSRHIVARVMGAVAALSTLQGVASCISC